MRAPTLGFLAVLALSVPSFASAAGMTAVPKCASGDTIVVVNTKTKTYTTMSTPNSMKSMPTGTMAMCKSKAVKMGAKIAPGMSSSMPAPTAPPSGVEGPMVGPTSAGARPAVTDTPGAGPPSHSP
jgi:hypothetical protein